jgi:hypothetical protein
MAPHGPYKRIPVIIESSGSVRDAYMGLVSPCVKGSVPLALPGKNLIARLEKTPPGAISERLER